MYFPPGGNEIEVTGAVFTQIRSPSSHFHPMESTLIASSSQGCITRLWNANTGELEAKFTPFEGHSGKNNCLNHVSVEESDRLRATGKMTMNH